MEHDKKLAFISNMTDKALMHVARAPNIAAPNGGMSHDKMLSFVTAMTKHGLQQMGAGGVAGWLGMGNDFAGTNANTTPGTDTSQLNTAYTHAGSALGRQTGLAKTLTPGTEQGAGNQASLANMYLNQAQGNGPSPAQAMLNQNTGTNIAQQAALMAGQRGAGANAGNLAENAARVGAATQQQAVGQSATLGAQQQLAAQQNLQNLSATQVGQGQAAVQGLNNAAQNEQNILQGANTSYNNALVGMQSNVNNVNAGVAAANQQATEAATSGITGALAPGASFVGSFFAKGGEVKKPAAKKPLPRMMAEGGVTGQPTSAPQSFIGNWLSSNPLVSAPNVEAYSGTTGGPMPKFGMDDKGGKQKAAPPKVAKDTPPPASEISPEEMNVAIAGADDGAMASGAADLSTVGEGAAAGDAAVAGETAGAAEGAEGLGSLAILASKGGLMKAGGKVTPHNSKQEAKVEGDSLKNDKIPTLLSQGEIVIPRHITMGPNAPAKAALFVARELAKRGKK